MAGPRDEMLLHWSSAGPARRIEVWVTGWDFGWEVHCGDRIVVSQVGDRPGEHRFAHTGSYWLTASIQGQSDLFGEQQCLVRGSLQPLVYSDFDPDDPQVVRVHFPALDDTGVVSHYGFDWGDGTGHETVLGYPGTFAAHRYQPGANQSVLVTDHNTRRIKRLHFDITGIEPDFDLTVDGSTVTLTTSSGKELVVAWGDGGLTEPVTDRTASHTYPDSQGATLTYLVQLWLADATKSVTKTVTIPATPPVGGP